MNGQAKKLAELIRDRAPLVQDGQLVVFASGKGGVGKSQLVANLGIELAQRGLRVGLVDLDLSLANLDLVLGVRPELTLEQVVTEETGWRECLVPGPGGVDLLPAGSGLARLASLPPDIRKRLLAALQAYGQERDIVLGDAPSGLSSNVLGFLAASRPPVLVTLPDPTAQADAYGVMKALRGLGSTSPVSLIVNRVRTATEGVRVYEKLASMAERFLDAKIRYLGAVPEDRFVAEAGRAREPFRIKRPSSAAARALSYVADQLLVARLTTGDDERSPLLTHR